MGDGWAPKDRVFQGNRNASTMEHKASRLDVKSLPNWAQEAEERSLQRQSKKLRPLPAGFTSVTGRDEQTEAGKEGHPLDRRGVGVDRSSAPAGSCSYWLHTQLTQRLAVLVCPSSHTPLLHILQSVGARNNKL